MTDYTDIIARLVKATGPDRELDIATDRLVGGWALDRTHIEPMTGEILALPSVPRYTGSIDAALTLMPKTTLYWMVGFGRCSEAEPSGACAIYAPGELDDPVAQAEAETVELAVCIAALKARAAQSSLPADGE